MQRVVVTGMGAVTPIGNDVETFWQNLTAGQTGVARIAAFDPTPLEVQIAAEVKDFDPMQYAERGDAKRMDRFSQFAVAASKMAIDEAGLQIDPENSDNIAVMINTL